MSIYQLLDSDDMKFDIPGRVAVKQVSSSNMSANVFHTAVYQRPYSWQTKQVHWMSIDIERYISREP
jgi:uncharacterized protein with ParB-like and HNH nuclease domain